MEKETYTFFPLILDNNKKIYLYKFKNEIPIKIYICA